MKFAQFLKMCHAAYVTAANQEGVQQPHPVAAQSAPISRQTNSTVSSSACNSDNTQVRQPSKFKDVFYGSCGWNNRGRWIIQKFLKIGKVGIFAGASQSFKTFVLLRISMCVANGLSIGGYKIEQSDVHYVAAEGAADIAMRLHALEHIHGSVGDRISFSHRSIDRKRPATTG